MKIKRISALITSLLFINLVFNYLLSRISSITYLNAIPISLISIVILFPKINIKRFLCINFPLFIVLSIIFIDNFLASGFSILLIYLYLIFINQTFSFILIFEVLLNYFKKNWIDIIPNIGLIILIFQTIGYLFFSGEIRAQMFSTNTTALMTLVFFSKFYPDYNNKIKISDYIKAALSIFLMFIIQARFVLFFSLISLIISHTIKFAKIFFKINLINQDLLNKLKINGFKLFCLIISISLIAYYLFLQTYTQNIRNSPAYDNSLYAYISKVENCNYQKNNKETGYYRRNCIAVFERPIIYRDASILIRFLSDYKYFEKISNQYLDLIFPFNKLKSSENSIEKDRNYLGRSHNLLITLLDNYGILFLLALLYSLFYYEKLLKKRGIFLNLNSYIILLIFLYSYNEFYSLVPLLLFQKDDSIK